MAVRLLIAMIQVFCTFDSLSNYHPKDHNYVNSIKWTVNPENTSTAVVDSTVYLDGELRVQQSVIKRVK